MGVTKKYWTGLDELHETEGFQESVQNEFPEETQTAADFLAEEDLDETSTPRRDFLKFMGFSVTAATLAACEAPVIKSIPYINRPAEIVPGVANFYASTYYDGNDYGNVLVKTREGRPIFIKPNADFGEGGINSRINSSVISLYDEERLRGPQVSGAAKTWSQVDKEIASELASAKTVKVLSSTIVSPTTKKAINEFCARYNAELIQYDAISYSGLKKANNGIVPKYDFSKARTIVSIAADFIGTWLTPNLFQTQYTKRRQPEGSWMSQHFQFETNMSLTGSNADQRVMIKPSEEGKVAAALYKAISGGSVSGLSDSAANMVTMAANKLKANRDKGASLVVSGSNDSNVQRIVAEINSVLGNEGVTVDSTTGINLFQGDDSKTNQLVKDMNAGKVDALIVYGVNPAYSLPNASEFRAGLSKVNTSISFNSHADETGSRCKYMCPDNHSLESWNDLSPYNGKVDLAQPAINQLWKTRPAQESLLKWADNDMSWYNYLRTNYNSSYSAATKHFDTAWNKAVMTGTMAGISANSVVESAESDEVANEETIETAPVASNVNAAISAIASVPSGDLEVKLYEKVGIGAGNHAGNPFLQELPDPLTKVTWDNYITMAPSDMRDQGIGDHIYLGQRTFARVGKVTVNGNTLALPIMPQPGQTPGTIGIALGYGRGDGNEAIGRSAYQTGEYGDYVMSGDGENGARTPIGANVFGFVSTTNGDCVYSNVATLEITAEEYKIASTQMHSTVMGRESVVKETTLSQFAKEKNKPKGMSTYNVMPGLVVHEDVNHDGEIDGRDKSHVRNFDLWEAHSVEEVGHRWGMSIDLGACNGCSACVTACHIENNVPVVGKDEVHRHRDMHWMRIDRYYSSEIKSINDTDKIEEKGLGAIGAYRDMENPEDNPQTVHMPMMCQHCNHAPCETVCPVAATTHSNEGLNQMTYNRCIGTRYCANNCPYKVRRFNWFNYQAYKKFKHITVSQQEYGRMVLNPDVTVRSRGVMEKCSLCVQRIQAGKLDAKKASTPVADGAIQTACAEACPANAITFGDLNDKKSMVTALSQDNRAYSALEEIGVQPNMYYQTIVRNTEA